jgi:hypothetical protein
MNRLREGHVSKNLLLRSTRVVIQALLFSIVIPLHLKPYSVFMFTNLVNAHHIMNFVIIQSTEYF